MNALVVDDEEEVRNLAVRSLRRQGFECDTAADGDEALACVAKTHYDAVITDLKMPNKHGHALAVHLLSLERRPVIVVLTGLSEPKLARDLLGRGVDDIVYKPADFGALAAKVMHLVESRPASNMANVAPRPVDGDNDRSPKSTPDHGPLLRTNLQSKLSGVTRVDMITSALAALASGKLPWFDVDLARNRSMAAGLALAMLVDEGKHQKIEGGLTLGALLHPLGRVVLGTSYPKHYQTLIDHCRRNHEMLSERESNTFPISHAEVLADLLEAWGIPDDVYGPLRHVLADYESLKSLSDPNRLRVELVKMAVFVGEIAVGRWDTWDTIELPPSTLSKRLSVASIVEIIQRTKREVDRLAKIEAFGPEATIRQTPARQIPYCDLSGSQSDLLGEIIASMGFNLVKVPEGDRNDLDEHVLVNCIDTAPHRLVAMSRRVKRQYLSIVVDAKQAEIYKEHGNVLALPVAFGSLRSFCHEIAAERAPAMAGS